MFQRDPIEIALGKDVACLIHRINHRKFLNELNAEYHRRVTDEYRDSIAFDGIAYNWRSLHVDKQFLCFIYNHTKTPGEMTKRKFCVKFAKLPKHY